MTLYSEDEPVSQAQFVAWFRAVAPYVHAFKRRVFVIAFGGEAVLAGRLKRICEDLALLRALGIRVVVVHGSRPQIEEQLRLRQIDSQFVAGVRITDSAALECAKEAAGEIRLDIEAAFSQGLANTPMWNADIKVLSGNFITARPVGVVDGTDYQSTGVVRKVASELIEMALAARAVVLISPLGFSPTGEAFNLDMEDVAASVAATLRADKLLFLTETPGIEECEDELIRELSSVSANRLMASGSLPADTALYLKHALRAISAGVSGFGQNLMAGYGATTTAPMATSLADFTIDGDVTIATAPTSIKVAFGEGGYGWAGVAASGGYASGACGPVTLTSSTVITGGSKHHLEVDGSAQGCQLYVDGNLAASSATPYVQSATTYTQFAVHEFGGNLGTFTWPGTVDEVAVWNIVRHNAAFTPPASPYVGSEVGLVALYHLDGNGADSGQAPAAAPTFSTVSDNLFTGGASSASGAPGTFQAQGLYDIHGSHWSRDANGYMIDVVGVTLSYNNGETIRPAAENSVDSSVTEKWIQSSASASSYSTDEFHLHRWSNPGAAGNGYAIACGGGSTASSALVQFYRIIAGTPTGLGNYTISTPAAATTYVCKTQVYQLTPTTTALTATIYASDGATVIASFSTTDAIASLQNLAGAAGMYEYNSAAGALPNEVVEFATGTDATTPATSYAMSESQPGGTANVQSTTFAIAANGPLSSPITVTPSDGSGCTSCFSPSSETLNGTASALFTYTPPSSGTKSISATNSGALTNPSVVTYTVAILIPPSSPAWHLSPANWQCYGARACAAGVTNPRTQSPGAYACVAWNAAASSPTASLIFSSNPTGAPVSVFINGVLHDGLVTTNGTLPISGIVAGSTNQVMFVVKSVQNANFWGNTGSNFNGLELDGLQVDSASTAGVAPAPCQPSGVTGIGYSGWWLVQGTSINVGYVTDAGTDNYLHSNIWLAAQSLFAKGYDVGTVAESGTGIMAPRNGTPGLCVPAIVGGPCVAANSRWFLTDAGIPMTDANNHLSAYGATGTEPKFIFSNEGTNDANLGMSLTLLPTATSDLITTEQAAAPAAKIGLLIDFPLDAGTASNASSYRGAITSGAGASGDANLTFADFGGNFGYMIENSSVTGVLNYDSIHPLAAGNAIIAPKMANLMDLMMAAPSSSTSANVKIGIHSPVGSPLIH